MTSGIYKSVPIEDVIINRGDRQRTELRDLESLAASIQNAGLINAPVVTPDLVLIAGERRFTACRDLLNWTHITVQIAASSDEVQAYLIELEENIKRSSLDWKDRCHAVAAYHNQRLGENAAWTNEQTAEVLGMATASTYYHRKLSEELTGDDELILNAPKYSVARGILMRKLERREATEAEKITSNLDTFFDNAMPSNPDPQKTTLAFASTASTTPNQTSPTLTPPKIKTYTNVPLINTDFTLWQSTYSGEKFNFIHCDFPYGINHNTHHNNATDAHGSYADTKDIYFTLLDTLTASMENVVAQSAHLMFWFSMKYYSETLSRLEVMGWKVYENPLIWDKNNIGVLADPSRTPRHTYEVCFFASRGDRKIVRAKADIVNAIKKSSIHTSEKSETMLYHFFEMLVDETTYMLDPTAGSGTAIGVCESIKGARALGLEIDPEFYELACEKYDTYWRQRKGIR